MALSARDDAYNGVKRDIKNDKTINGVTLFAWWDEFHEEAIYTEFEHPSEGVTVYNEQLEIIGSVEAYSPAAKGVITRLIDENGNDLPYDFKNVKFFLDYRFSLADGESEGDLYYDENGDTSAFVYTFSDMLSKSSLGVLSGGEDMSTYGYEVVSGVKVRRVPDLPYVFPCVFCYANGEEWSGFIDCDLGCSQNVTMLGYCYSVKSMFGLGYTTFLNVFNVSFVGGGEGMWFEDIDSVTFTFGGKEVACVEEGG